MAIIFAVMVMVAADRVGTGLRIERSSDQGDVPAKTLDHLADHMVRSNADAIAQQLHRQMAITEMPGDTNKFAILMRMDFHQVLGLGADPDNAVFDHQPVAISQPHRLRQIDQ